MRGDDLGVGAVGTAHAHPHAAEVAAPEAAPRRLEPVVAREPATEANLDATEGQVDLVVHGHDVVELHAERATRGAHGAARLVHVGLRQEHADGPPGPVRPSV